MNPELRRLAILLAALSAMGPFAIDTYLPAFPAMANDLRTTDLAVQQTLAAYMIPFAFMMFWHGPLADAHGRRRVLILGLGGFALASVVCALAPSIEWLWLGRALQGMVGGAGMVVARAVVRDLYAGVEAQKLMATIAVLFAIAPAIAPLIGGGLLLVTGWRGIFWFLALLAAALCLLSWRRLPETLPPERRHPFNPTTLWLGYSGVARHHRFRRLALASAFNFIGLFIYVLAAPIFLIRLLGYTPQQFGWLFIPTVAGMMAGSTLAGRLAGQRTPHQSLLLAYSIMGTAAVANVALNLAFPPGPWCIAPLVLYAMGMALAMPTLQLLALDLVPARRGLASSCLGVAQTTTNALAASLIVPLLWNDTLHLALGMAGCVSIGLVTYLMSRRHLPEPVN
ncbi:MAG: multidrug effflux MFS transporter [Rhodocyclaceae bacterium]|nr:multidrug effflux MFS transporter [Rhodocyclaceae bacterium]